MSISPCVHLVAPRDRAAPAYLQERLLGEDGNPRKTKDNEDPFRMGLVLEWVYGTIVSTAEKARDSAKKPLGELPWLAYACGKNIWSYTGSQSVVGMHSLGWHGGSDSALLEMATETLSSEHIFVLRRPASALT